MSPRGSGRALGRDRAGEPEVLGAAADGGVRSLQLLLTTACNLRCSYCCRRRRRPERMKWSTVRRAIDWATSAGQGEVKVAFSGGEPLLDLPLLRRAVAYAPGRPGRRRPVRYLLMTNGLLLDQRAAAFLSARRFQVQLSFDGVPEAQALRSPDSFRRLDRLLDDLRRDHRGFYRRRLSVAMTVLPQTVSSLAESFSYFLGKQVREIAIAPTLASSLDWVPGRITEAYAQYERIMRMSLAHYRVHGEIPLVDFRGRHTAARGRRRPRSMCGVISGATPAVDADGKVYGCAMLAGPALSGMSPWLAAELRRLRIGDLADPALPGRMERFRERVCASRILTAKQAKRSSYGRCADCPAFEACGICPVSIGMQEGNANPDRIPDLPCALTRAAARASRRFHREIGDLAGG